MRINFIPTVIALAISFLIAYGLYYFHESENKFLVSSGSFIFLAVTLITTIGIRFELPRTTTNIKVVSGIFFSIGLISSIIFTLHPFSIPSYILTNGILLLLFVLIAYSINKAQQ